jgi:hypothetical protein
MAKEPDSLILTLLRELRAEQGATREDIRDLRDQMMQMRKDMRDWQETTATATGFAMHANLRNQALEAEIADLKRRVETLERAK